MLYCYSNLVRSCAVPKDRLCGRNDVQHQHPRHQAGDSLPVSTNLRAMPKQGLLPDILPHLAECPVLYRHSLRHYFSVQAKSKIEGSATVLNVHLVSDANERFVQEKAWKPFLPGKCVNFNAILIAAATINVVSDFTILILPIRSIWNLKMPTRRKLGISSVFGVGLL